jgi:tetratricopeptide (TPR) repeat protein
MRKPIVSIRFVGLLLIASITCISFQTQAQQTAVYSHEDNDYRAGLELFEKQKYGAAQEKFEEAIARINNAGDEIFVNAEYYRALCALELFNKDAEFLLSEFIKDHPESPRVRTAYFQLGRYHYRRKKYRDAIEWLEKVDEYDLSHKELAEFYFKKGYSYFKVENFDEASKNFYEIKEIDNEYRDPALYYYAHIAYTRGNHQTALQGFEQLKAHPSFGAVVPYYIAQIYFLQKRYEQLIAYAPPLLDTAKVKREAEISRIIGEAYFNTDRHAEAIPYLERYQLRSSKVTREDFYQLGYAYYKGKDYEKAIVQFNRVVAKKDALSQAANYHIADCYLKTDDKTNARSAFRLASKLPFDPEIKENSLYNYAKLSYELSYNPYNEAIKAFEEYLITYPNSPRKEEAYEYLVNVYLTTRNYSKAMESLDKIPNKGLRLQTAYQLVAFNSGVELFISSDYPNAIEAMKGVQLYPIDKNMSAEAVYWSAESYYQLKDYKKAITNYELYRVQPGAILNQYFKLSNYNIGYANFKQEKYAESIPYFRTYVDVASAVDQEKVNDAYLRIGDGYFVARKFEDAIIYYDDAVRVAKKDVDYALYQKAYSLGLLQRYDEKIVALKKLLAEHNKSLYLADATFEIAEAYRLKPNQDYGQALTYYQKVASYYPLSSKAKRSELNIGLIHYKKGDDEKAIAIFEKIAKDSKTYDEAKDALVSLKDILVQRGEVQRWENLIASLKYVDFSRGEMDSTNYLGAENLYFDEKWEAAISAFGEYLMDYNPAIFSVKAHYYKAVAHYRLEQIDLAINEFNAVIQQGLTDFYEEALVSHARLNFGKEDWQGAMASFMSLERVAENQDYTLESQIGIMRCLQHLGNCTSAIDAAQKVLNNEKTPQEVRIEAEMVMARCYYEMDMQAQAMEQCQRVVDLTTTEYGAEAQYYIGMMLHAQGKYQDSDDAIYDLVKLVPSYDYWIAMGYLLIVENSLEMGDFFQAKATLQSIIDNYNGSKQAEILRRAQKRLDEIIALENGGAEIRNEESNEVDIDNLEPGQEDLFRDDPDGGERENRRDRRKPNQGAAPSGNDTVPSGTNGTEGGQQ